MDEKNNEKILKDSTVLSGCFVGLSLTFQLYRTMDCFQWGKAKDLEACNLVTIKMLNHLE